MAGKKLKVGIIGAGWQAENHLRGYLRSGKAEIVAVADLKEEMARGLMKKFDFRAKCYDSYQNLLADPEVEAVSILAPNKFHSEITIAAARAGKHMLAEKPFVTSPAEAKASWDALKASGVKCAVGYHRRFNPICKEIVSLKKQGKLGNIFFAQSDYVHNLPDELPIWDWIGKKALNPSLFHAGGTVSEQLAELAPYGFLALPLVVDQWKTTGDDAYLTFISALLVSEDLGVRSTAWTEGVAASRSADPASGFKASRWVATHAEEIEGYRTMLEGIEGFPPA